MDHAQLLKAVQEAVSGTYDVLGEMGRDERQGAFYLGRELSSQHLVVLALERSSAPEGGDEFTMEILRELDASVPDVESSCPRCKKPLRRWARFCTQCGLDVSGVGTSGRNASRAELLEAVRAAASGTYEVLGEIPRKEGGGLVYFGREYASGKIVALRLQQEGQDEFALGVTQVLKPLTTGKTPRATAPVNEAVISIVHGKSVPREGMRRPSDEVAQAIERVPTEQRPARPRPAAPTPRPAPPPEHVRPAAVPTPQPTGITNATRIAIGVSVVLLAALIWMSLKG